MKRGRKIENLARTGVEYAFMRDLGHAPFIESGQPEKEPLVDHSVAPYILDEYIRSDASRCLEAGSATFPVVFDYLE